MNHVIKRTKQKVSLRALPLFFSLRKQGVAISPYPNNEIATSAFSMKVKEGLLAMTVCLLAMIFMGGCKSNSSEQTAQDPGPDNAVTQYVENLTAAQQKAQVTAGKANDIITRQNDQMQQINKDQMKQVNQQ